MDLAIHERVDITIRRAREQYQYAAPNFTARYFILSRTLERNLAVPGVRTRHVGCERCEHAPPAPLQALKEVHNGAPGKASSGSPGIERSHNNR